jgi:hypothetical protein
MSLRVLELPQRGRQRLLAGSQKLEIEVRIGDFPWDWG